MSAGEVVTIVVSTNQRMDDEFENFENKSQVITADDDIIAYASNKQVPVDAALYKTLHVYYMFNFGLHTRVHKTTIRLP